MKIKKYIIIIFVSVAFADASPPSGNDQEPANDMLCFTNTIMQTLDIHEKTDMTDKCVLSPLKLTGVFDLDVIHAKKSNLTISRMALRSVCI